MSSTIYESRLIDKMTGNRSQMPAFIIGHLRAPHSKGDLDPGVGKTPESMMRAFAFIAFLDKLLSSPGA